jgi:hypothetical protein
MQQSAKSAALARLTSLCHPLYHFLASKHPTFEGRVDAEACALTNKKDRIWIATKT